MLKENPLQSSGGTDLITCRLNQFITGVFGLHKAVKRSLHMKVNQVAYSRLSLWSHTDLAYLTHDPALAPFVTYPAVFSSFREIIKHRKDFPVDRPLLHRVLLKQYQALGISLPVSESILLNENTYTVTTAHQPTLLTGPLYHIYKIASTIHLAGELTHSLPEQTVVPVFVIGGEDHDWEEVNHFNLFGRRYEWERTASGPCGRLSLEGLEKVIGTITELFSNTPFGAGIKEMVNTCLEKASNYGQFHHMLVHSLFGHLGLVVINMDDPELKKAFVPLMEKEIREQFSIKYVPPTQSALEAAGFKAQAFCRPLNLFYMTDGMRERLDVVDGDIKRLESNVTYSTEEAIEELKSHPERFSPNVIMRPLYQETILPNLAYIGGGGEIAYWLERKSQFAAAGVHFPMLIRRNSLMLIDAGTSGQMQKADITWEDLLSDYDSIVKSYLKRHSQAELNFEEELQMIKSAYEVLSAKAEKIDPTLASAILAEETKQSKQFEQLGSRLMRAEKQLQDTNLKRIQKLKEKLFPENGLQERNENFLSFYAQYGQQWIEDMITICDPFDENFIVAELQA